MPAQINNFGDITLLEKFLEQSWLSLPVSGLDVRFFLKGPMLDAGSGEAVASRAALSSILGHLDEPYRMIAPRQVYGTAILETSSDNAAPDVKADGILFGVREARSLGLEASLRFADCAPVVVAPSPEWVESAGEPWVLMMHSGYKGTVLNIVSAGLKKARGRYGKPALDGAWAWVGPCIGFDSYPRDIEEWTLRGLETFRNTNVKREGEKVYFDIAGELRLQLLDAGIAEDCIFLSGIDTCKRTDSCYSYRSGEQQRRMFLWARAKA